MPQIISDLIPIGNVITETAASTYTSEEISIPSAAREGIGCIIVGVDFQNELPDDVASGAGAEKTVSQLTEEEETSLVNCEDPDVIGRKTVFIQGNGTNPTNSIVENIGLVGKLVSPQEGYKTMRDKVYHAVIGTAAGSTMSSNMKLYLYIAKFSTAERVDLGFRESYE